MNIESHTQKHSVINLDTTAFIDKNKVNNFTSKITNLTSSVEKPLVFKQTQKNIETTHDEIKNNKSTLKKIIEYVLGISIFTGITYFIVRGLLPGNIIPKKTLTLNEDNVNNLLNVEYFSDSEANITEKIVRKSRQIHSFTNHLYPFMYYHNKIKEREREREKEKNSPYRYYYNDHQQEKCNKKNFLDRCQKEHKRAESICVEYNKLALEVDNYYCLCPPPENKNVIIIPSPFQYTYPHSQHNDCNSSESIIRCQEYHKTLDKVKNKYVNELTFVIKNTTCYCPPFKELIVCTVAPGMEIDNRVKKTIINLNKKTTTVLIKRKQKITTLPTQIKQNIAKVPEKKQPIGNSENSVTIKKMYDFSCVDESEKINFSKVLEIISKTLKNPISMLAVESEKIHQYNTMHLGCPSEETTDKIKEIAGLADKIVNVFVQFLPYNKGLIIAQNIISPLLISISKDLDNNPLDIESIEEVNVNSLFIFQDFVRSMSFQDLENIKSMNEEAIKKKTVDSLNKKFKFNKEGLNIIYNDREHMLNFDTKKRPYIKEGDADIIVGYNEVKEKWDRIDNDYMHFYSRENINNAKEYSISNIHYDTIYNLEGISSPKELEHVLSEYPFGLHHVFIGEDIIPIQSFNLFDGEECFITSVVNMPKKVVIKTPFGFVFDKDSTDVSYFLGLYIEYNIEGKFISDIDRYSKIHDDKISYDKFKKPHIKYKNIYYAIYPYDEENNIYSMRSKKYNEEIYIELKNFMFDFHESTILNNLDFFKESSSFLSENQYATISKPYEMIPLKSEHHDVGYIDSSAYTYLLSNGESVDKNIIELQKIDSLIYTDKQSNTNFLNVNDRLYAIQENGNSDGIMLIKNQKSQKNIEIYRHENSIILVKEKKHQEEYLQLKNCKNKRDLTELSCMPIYISRSLKRKFDRNMYGAHSISINDVNVKLFRHRPGFFYIENKFYYYYNGRSFEIKLTYKDNKKNNEIINVYAKSIFKTKRKIASFVFEKKNGRIELKEPDLWLAEKTGNDREDMDFLLASNEYYTVPNIFDINNAINEVNRSNNLIIIRPKNDPDIIYSDKDIMKYCHENFYNKNPDIKFNLLKMNEVTYKHDFHLWAGKIKAESHLKHAQNVLKKSISLLKKPSRDLDEYLKSILSTDNKTIINKFIEELLIALEQTLSKLDSNIIYLVSAIKKPYDNSPFLHSDTGSRNPIHYKKALDEIDTRTGTFAFATRIKKSRIYVCVDRFYFIDPTHPDESLHNYNEVDLAEALIHEASHAGYGTDDFFYMPRQPDGLLMPIMKSRNMFIKQIPTMKGKYYNSLSQSIKEYIKMIAIYNKWQGNLLTDKSALSFFVSKDVGVMANIYLKNADFITKIAKDIYHLDIVDKGSLHYYSHLLNVGHTLMAPVKNLLDIAEYEPLNVDNTRDSLQIPVGKDRSLHTIYEEEEATDLENTIDEK